MNKTVLELLVVSNAKKKYFLHVPQGCLVLEQKIIMNKTVLESSVVSNAKKKYFLNKYFT